MIPMKALKDFRGREGEGRHRMVEAGVEFLVTTQGRANDLEARGLAVPAVRLSKRKAEVEMTTTVNPVKNEASDSGPLGSAGGPTGGQQRRPLFSRPARAQRTQE